MGVPPTRRGRLGDGRDGGFLGGLRSPSGLSVASTGRGRSEHRPHYSSGLRPPPGGGRPPPQGPQAAAVSRTRDAARRHVPPPASPQPPPRFCCPLCPAGPLVSGWCAGPAREVTRRGGGGLGRGPWRRRAWGACLLLTSRGSSRPSGPHSSPPPHSHPSAGRGLGHPKDPLSGVAQSSVRPVFLPVYVTLLMADLRPYFGDGGQRSAMRSARAGVWPRGTVGILGAFWGIRLDQKPCRVTWRASGVPRGGGVKSLDSLGSLLPTRL